MMMMMVMMVMVMVMMMMMMMITVIIYCKMIVEISGWWRYFLIGHPTCDEDPFWPAFFGGGALKSSTRE